MTNPVFQSLSAPPVEASTDAALLASQLGVPVPLIIAVATVLFLLARYVVIAGGALGFITIFAPRIISKRIQKIPFTLEQYRREFGYSLLSILVFGALALVVSSMNAGLFDFSMPSSLLEWVWAVVAVPVALLMHDFYFYWMHRAAHVPGIYEVVHKVHHLSTNPSPLASFAFHPLEAILESFGFLLVVSLLPMSLPSFVAFSFLAFVFNVLGHLGYEFVPAKLLARDPMRWINSATSHNTHHRKFRVNFGLYTLIWDRLFGTIDPKFDVEIARVAR
jgi:sterol desaturase/sphingolipid hydroxylase (fatty acid hydroxylase superfamily)